MNLRKTQKKENLQKLLDDFFDKNFLDIQGLSPGITIDEAYLARILTKLAVSSATVWWSLLEIKQFLILRKNVRGN
jgi:hypothetical protein